MIEFQASSNGSGNIWIELRNMRFRNKQIRNKKTWEKKYLLERRSWAFYCREISKISRHFGNVTIYLHDGSKEVFNCILGFKSKKLESRLRYIMRTER